MEKGFICIFTLDRMDDLRRFLTSYLKHNSLPISVLFARNIEEAHRLKTRCGFLTPYDLTVLIDIDILVNGNLDDLFAPAEDGRIGIVREKKIPVLNSGVLVFPKDLMRDLCLIWNEKFEEKLIKKIVDRLGTWEQGLLNEILPQFPYVELPSEFNHILHDYTPEEELKIYDKIKLFHFLHHHGIDRTKYKSYQTFMSL